MKFVYEYRTSDNALHSGRIAALDRDAAFAALKARGIRPARLVEAPGLVNKVFGKGKRWIAIVALSVAAIAGWFFASSGGGDGAGHDFSGFSRAERLAFERLTAQADEVGARAAKARAAAGIERLDDYALVFATPDISPFYALVDGERQTINDSRRSLRRIFAAAIVDLPAGGEAARAAQAEYGRRMAELDAAEISVKNHRTALALLDSNRGKWRIEDGRPQFEDARAQRMFEYCLEGIKTDAETSRWHQDFSD